MIVPQIIEKCQSIYEDLDLEYVARWKREKEGRRAIGYTPIYFPQEILYAMDILPVGLMGGGDLINVVKGDSYYQSYICHIVRSIIDMRLSGKLNSLDGIITPFVCDVMRNLTGVLRTISDDKYTKFFDQPQNFASDIGGEYYASQLRSIVSDLNVGDISKEKLIQSIMLYQENRRLIRELYDFRSDRPWNVPLSEAYLLLRAGLTIDVKEHNELLSEYLKCVTNLNRKPEDCVRVILIGAFCEQPPLALLKVIEQAGCYVVYDDFFMGQRYLPDIDIVAAEKDPLNCIVESYLKCDMPLPCRWEHKEGRETWLLNVVRERKADGIIFSAPSFCDPALEERPIYQKSLDAAGIRHISFLYSEDTAQFSGTREQLGTFTDSIKIWG